MAAPTRTPTRLPRRAFLKTSALFGVWAALAACNPRAAPDEEQDRAATGTPPHDHAASPTPAATAAPPTAAPTVPPASGDAVLAHGLRRLTFGATPQLEAHARQVGVDAFIEEQLHPEAIADDAVEARVSQFATFSMTPQERFELERRAQPVQELIAATLLRQAASARQLYELVVDFWTNHFNIYILKDQCRTLKTDDDLHVIRPYALGRFADLLTASAHSPAMLVYLDQAASNQDVPNENYARELMELHTISVEAGYTHHDVVEVARALTGWTVSGPRGRMGEPGRFVYAPALHDDGEKHILGVHFPAGQGQGDGDQVLEILAAHPMTARFISAKLARRFVSDTPPEAVVDRLAATFTNTGGDIRAVLASLFAADEFRGSAGQKTKRPLEFFVSALRVTGAAVREDARPIYDHLALMGQAPFQWAPPDGYPDAASYWMTTSGLLNRWNFGMLLTGGLLRGAQVNLSALTADAASPADVVDVLAQRFTGERLPGDARDILVDFASTGDLGDNLPAIAGLLLGSPHFQMR